LGRMKKGAACHVESNAVENSDRVFDCNWQNGHKLQICASGGKRGNKCIEQMIRNFLYFVIDIFYHLTNLL
jgi:hypothetical protein